MGSYLQANGYQEEKMSTNEKIERLEQQLLDEISKLTPGILPKLPKQNLRPFGDISLEVNCYSFNGIFYKCIIVFSLDFLI